MYSSESGFDASRTDEARRRTASLTICGRAQWKEVPCRAVEREREL